MAERILVVDDQRTTAEMTAGLLRNLGYEVDIAFDGRELIDTCAASLRDLICGDILIPGVDGY